MSNTRHTYEEAVLTVMGCADTSFRGGPGVTYRLLLEPTFHRTSCVVFTLGPGAVEAQIVVLEADCYDLFLASLKQDPRLIEGDFLALRACAGDLAELSSEHAERVRWRIPDVRSDALPPDPTRVRDGINLRFDRFAPDGTVTVRMWSPTPEEAPAHHRLVLEIVAIAHGAFPAFRGYLEEVTCYLGASTRDLVNRAER